MSWLVASTQCEAGVSTIIGVTSESPLSLFLFSFAVHSEGLCSATKPVMCLSCSVLVSQFCLTQVNICGCLITQRASIDTLPWLFLQAKIKEWGSNWLLRKSFSYCIHMWKIGALSCECMAERIASWLNRWACFCLSITYPGTGLLLLDFSGFVNLVTTKL